MIKRTLRIIRNVLIILSLLAMLFISTNNVHHYRLYILVLSTISFFSSLSWIIERAIMNQYILKNGERIRGQVIEKGGFSVIIKTLENNSERDIRVISYNFWGLNYDVWWKRNLKGILGFYYSEKYPWHIILADHCALRFIACLTGLIALACYGGLLYFCLH